MSYRRGWVLSVACGLVALSGAGLLTAGCDTALPIVGGTSPTSVSLQPSDLPKDLERCPSSGDINSYLANLKTKNVDGYNGTLDAWKKLQAQGAKNAAIVSYAADPAACTGEMGTGRGRTAASFVIQFKDDGSAAIAWKHGILGFPSPTQGQQTPGLKVGTGTGLGANSWSLEEAVQGRSLYLAFWQGHSFDVFFLGEDLTQDESQRALSSVAGRVR